MSVGRTASGDGIGKGVQVSVGECCADRKCPQTLSDIFPDQVTGYGKVTPRAFELRFAAGVNGVR